MIKTTEQAVRISARKFAREGSSRHLPAAVRRFAYRESRRRNPMPLYYESGAHTVRYEIREAAKEIAHV